MDEAGFYLLPGVLKTDSPEGLTPMIPAWQTRDHQSVMGALTSRGRVYVLVRREALGCRSPTAEPSLDSVVLQERGTNPVNFTSLRNDRELRGKYRSGVVEAQYVTDDVRLSVRCGGTGGEILVPSEIGAMRDWNRREFLADVGRSMLVASVGASVAQNLGLTSALAEEATESLTFGKMEPLVALMQETPVNQLLPRLVQLIQGGTELRTLVAAGALANAHVCRARLYRLPRVHGSCSRLGHGTRAA